MADVLRIDFEWLASETGTPAERATLAEFEITVGSQVATTVEDRLARTVRSRVRLSAFHLASWVASNWWRLRWEPKRSDLSWQLSHRMGGAGGGYLWPDLTFASDGEAVLIGARPTDGAPAEPVRYLMRIDQSISANIFERAMDDLVDAVCARLASAGVETDLAPLWAEVRSERQTPEAHLYRRLEALLGHDPDAAPQDLVAGLREQMTLIGTDAVAEVAADARDNALTDLNTLWHEVRPKAVAVRLAESGQLRTRIRHHAEQESVPWQGAEKAAALARTAWNLPHGPVPNRDLARICDMPETVLHGAAEPAPFPAAFRNGAPDNLAVTLCRSHPTGRRFALARLIGDHLSCADDHLLPATGARTARQKFQRAFAQAFLCPFDDLRDFLGTDAPTDEDIEAAGAHFEVSPRVVETTLVNKGLMDRDILDA